MRKREEEKAKRIKAKRNREKKKIREGGKGKHGQMEIMNLLGSCTEGVMETYSREYNLFKNGIK